jgi:hypothetical protein
MPNWTQVLQEIIDESIIDPTSPIDKVRRKYLKSISDHTGRNTIAYYSWWLQRPTASDTAVNDKDKWWFMLAIHGMDRSKGLDLILHTPGGDTAATESLVDYLYSMFWHDIRVIVPQLSMSAWTMIALASKEIIMGKHSNLGPIDPQMWWMPCQGILDEFEHAKNDIAINPSFALIWQPIIGKYHPTFLWSCQQSIVWSKEITSKWLLSNMCAWDKKKVKKIIGLFSDHRKTKAHARHISTSECKAIWLNIQDLESDPILQEAVLTTHHAFMHTFSNTPTVKLIENDLGIAFIEQVAS